VDANSLGSCSHGWVVDCPSVIEAFMGITLLVEQNHIYGKPGQVSPDTTEPREHLVIFAIRTYKSANQTANSQFSEINRSTS
jgi:hypothetical protein